MRTVRSAVQVAKKYMAYDDFNRADGVLGTSVSGHVWTDVTGVWNIVSSQVRQTTDANGGYTFIASMPGPDYAIFVKITALNTYVELIARRSSSTVFCIAAIDAAGSGLLLRNSGNVTLASSGSGMFAVNDVLGLSVKGPNIMLLRNGVAILSAVDYTMVDGLGVGIRNGVGGAVGTKVYDDFRVIYPI